MSNNGDSNEKEVDFMAVMTKPNAFLPVIDGDKTSKFLKKSNAKKLDKNFLDNCQKSARLFEKKYNEN